MSNEKLLTLLKAQLGYHTGIFGVTGSGKTRFAMKLVSEASRLGLKVCIVDVEGEWKNIILKLCGDVVYYSATVNLKINPFDLNDYGLVRRLLRETIFKGIEVEDQDLSQQMRWVLDKCILKSRSIPELISNVENYRGEDVPFKLTNLDRTKTALIVRLDPFRVNPVLREIFYCTKSSIDLDSLEEKNIIIDMHGLDSEANYTTELRLVYNTIAVVYLRKALKRQTTDEPTNMFVLEEAQHLAPKILRKALVTDTWATVDFATRLRKRGVGLVVISQSLSNIEDDMRKNLQNNFYFRIEDGEDIAKIAKSLGYNWWTALDHFTKKFLAMKPRECVVKTLMTENPFLLTSLTVERNTVWPWLLDNLQLDRIIRNKSTSKTNP